MNQLPVIIFDGICNLCCGWVQFIIRRDKNMKFRFAALQSENGIRLLNSIDVTNRGLETIVYIKGSNFFVESSAVLEILFDIGGFWRLFIVFRMIPTSIRDGIYRTIAGRRYTIFGKRNTCLIPTAENQKRFLQ